jgi:hypothetical protein
LSIVWSVLLRFTALITAFCIFKLVVEKPEKEIKNGQSRNTGSIWQKTQIEHNKARTNNKNNKENELHQKQGPTHELILA